MIDKKSFRAAVKQVIKENNGSVSVCNQYVDAGGLAFANMRDVKVSWGRDELSLFIPKEITFTVPYRDIVSHSVSPMRKQINIELVGRRLVSIRELQ